MKKKYRIQGDNFAGYEVRQWVWYWPFWVQCEFSNTHRTIDDAKNYIDRRRNIIEY